MEWQIELLKALVGLVGTGGTYAIWGIVSWWIFTLIKIGGILCFLGFFIRQISNVLHSCINKHYSHKLCKQDTKRLETLNGLVNSFRQCQDTTAEAMRDFLKEGEDLLKQCKEIFEVVRG